MPESLSSQPFGRAPGGGTVEAWTLSGRGGLTLEIITLGATITRLLVPDREGRSADVVLGFNDVGSYLTSRAYLGATIGRVAGRITGARFDLDGKTYELAVNDAPNHLHGGNEGFHRKIWTAAPVHQSNGMPSLRFEYVSPDGEEGYPGSVRTAVTYTVTDDNVVEIESHATADRPTPFNLTHHSYFNLAGEGAGNFLDHELQIHADEFVPTDRQMTLLGQLQSVTGRHNDFRRPRGLDTATPMLFQQHGDLYRIRTSMVERGGLESVVAARLVHRRSGRVLEVSTTAAYLQFYTGAGLDGSLIGKSGAKYPRHAGLCLECEGYPDGANDPGLGNIILKPGFPQREITQYRFGISSE